MNIIGIVHGSIEQAKPLIVGKDTVYIHTDIELVSSDDGELYKYHEIQLTLSEYIQLMSDQLTDMQLALVEIYEGGILWLKYMLI